MNWYNNIRPVCMHASGNLFRAKRGGDGDGGGGLEWERHDALAVSATEEWLTVQEKRSADGKAACPRIETSSGKHSLTKSKPDQTEKTDRAGTRTGTSLSYLGQSSPSSGVISVSLCTTTLVTDMSGCCSLASFMAWARAYIQECSAKRDHQGETENREGGEGAGMLDCKSTCQQGSHYKLHFLYFQYLTNFFVENVTC